MKALYYSLAVVVVDQISKLLVKGFNITLLGLRHRGMHVNRSIKIIDDFFQITYVENYGIAFGIDLGKNFKIAVSIFTLVASLCILYYLFVSRHKSFGIRLAIALIFGGAVGNLIDRTFYGIFYQYAPLFHGRVVDFLHFDFFDYSLFGKYYDSLPIFNIADVSVFIGTVLLLYYSLRAKKIEEPNEGEEAWKSENTIEDV